MVTTGVCSAVKVRKFTGFTLLSCRRPAASLCQDARAIPGNCGRGISKPAKASIDRRDRYGAKEEELDWNWDGQERASGASIRWTWRVVTPRSMDGLGMKWNGMK